jgi:hypothetical protein
MINVFSFVPPKATWLPSEFAGGSHWKTQYVSSVRAGDC